MKEEEEEGECTPLVESFLTKNEELQKREKKNKKKTFDTLNETQKKAFFEAPHTKEARFVFRGNASEKKHPPSIVIVAREKKEEFLRARRKRTTR